MSGVGREYTYDGLGRRLTEKDAENATTTYTYDGAGRKISELNARGGLTGYVYDPAGNVTQVSTNAFSGVTMLESRTYDKLGNVTSRTDSRGNRTEYEYNSLGELKKEIAPHEEGETNPAATTYLYDRAGNVARRRTRQE